MPKPTCPKCSNTEFAISEVTPKGSRWKLYFVHCASSSCQAVVGVQEWNNIGAMLEAQNEAIKAIAKQLNVKIKL